MHFGVKLAIFPVVLLALAACGGEQSATSPTAPGGADAMPSAAQAVPEAAADAGSESSQEVVFEVSMSGSGDEDGAGTAAITLEPGSGEVCYELWVHDIDPPTAAHIHVGAAGESGGVAVPFNAPGAEGEWQGCVSADPATVQQIVANPAGYYVNVHNQTHPSGAIRGQLGDASGT